MVNGNMESKIAQVLKMAQGQLSFSLFVVEYPKSVGMNDFNPSSEVDIFYNNICNVFFYDSLLLTASLLGTDCRLISFWNWKEFISKKEKELKNISIFFESSSLKKIRDQIVGHIDLSNSANNTLYYNRRGRINEKYISDLKSVHLDLAREFNDYTKKNTQPYSSDYFDTTKNIQTMKVLIDKFKPTLTGSNTI